MTAETCIRCGDRITAKSKPHVPYCSGFCHNKANPPAEPETEVHLLAGVDYFAVVSCPACDGKINHGSRHCSRCGAAG